MLPVSPSAGPNAPETDACASPDRKRKKKKKSNRTTNVKGEMPWREYESVISANEITIILILMMMMMMMMI